jgi:hypothetical protein
MENKYLAGIYSRFSEAKKSLTPTNIRASLSEAGKLVEKYPDNAGFAAAVLFMSVLGFVGSFSRDVQTIVPQQARMGVAVMSLALLALTSYFIVDSVRPAGPVKKITNAPDFI